MSTRRAIVTGLLGLVAAACVGAPPALTPALAGDRASQIPANQTPQTRAAETAPAEYAAPDIDVSIEAVSLSHPPAAAAAAFEICRVMDWVARHGLEVIAGAGRIDRARDAVRYVPLTGREPEIQSDDPAWIVQFRGEIRVDRNLMFVDPTCIVVEGEGGFHGTGPVRVIGTDTLITPQPVASAPDRALPPLLP